MFEYYLDGVAIGGGDIVPYDTETIAKNETYHAKRFFEMLQEKAGSKDNIVLDAGYPFHAGSLIDGLRFAAIDEKSESTEIYPKFAETAEKEGFKDVAALYRMVAEVEKQHNIIFNYLYEAVKNDTLYKNDSPDGYRARYAE